MRTLYAVVATLLTASVMLQLYFAAVGVFSNPDDELFAIHGTNGRMVLPLLALLTLICAAIARLGKRMVWLSALPLVLILLQTVIFILTGVIFGVGPDSHASPPLAATLFVSLHALNGLAIVLLSLYLARVGWKLAGSLGSRRLAPENPAAENLSARL
ncbi:DUF6220 domain-containing protein [Microterricola viridarii]|uniref:Uncharacterized protein n=1 Tax=Microterricola viridarii TaxID=412690 RepID=A0A1H1XFJ0_9MICO|nr:DUF6220 domain-containing protein [Microterricola viridarii]SDT07539.1 hypothetical protein SAMN04489834_2769 [Microterricola viridarii]